MHITKGPPEYKGEPLSMLMVVTDPASDFSLWQWGKTFDALPKNLETINNLVGAGFEQVARKERRFTISHLFSQLCDVVIVENELYALSEDIERVKRVPASLVSTLNQEKAPPGNRLAMLQFLPPLNLGEYGMVDNGQGTQEIYNVTQLPEKSQDLWKNIMAAIHNLAEPFPEWIEHHPGHRESVSELHYNRFVTETRSQILKARGRQREEWKKTLETIEEGHKHVTKLRQSWLKPDWLEQWEGIKRMAQQLAADYHAFHLSLVKSGNKPIPDIADAFHLGIADIPTSQPFQAYPAAAIAPKEAWQQITSEKENEHILSLARVKPSGTTFVQLREETPETTGLPAALARMREQIEKLSDLDADVYLAMVAQMLKGIKDDQGNTWITAQQILDYRGIEPKMNKTDSGSTYIGGHRWDDIQAVSDCIRRMENVFIKIQEQEIIDDSAPAANKRKRPRTTLSRSSRLFMFGDKIEHKTLPLDGPSRAITIAWQYRESSWMMPFLEGSNRFIGVLFQKALNYDPYHERWEKRLARHFMFWLRTNASREHKPAVTINDLLTELNLDVEVERPQRTRERFEKAMNRLEADGLLTWSYKEAIELPARKWLPTWLQQQIVIGESPVIKSQYMTIEAKAKVIRMENRIERPRKPAKRGSKAKGK